MILDGFMELDDDDDAEWHCDVTEHCAGHCGDTEYNAESAELPVECSEDAFLMRQK